METNKTKFCVTVITVTWNAEKYLERCLESVSMQKTHPDCAVEHLVIDGGSTDGTVKILEKWQAQSPSIRRFISEPDKGLYDAMNKGALLSWGKIIVFLNSDDRFASPSAIFHSVQPILNGDCDYSCASAKFIAPDGTFLSYAIPDLSLPYINHPFNTQTMFVKREDFLNLGGHDLSYRIAADDEFDCKLIHAGKKGGIVDEITVIAQDGGFGVSHYYAHERARLLKTYEENILNLCDENRQYAYQYFLSLMRISKIHPASAKQEQRKEAGALLLELHTRLRPFLSLTCRLTSKMTCSFILSKLVRGGHSEKYGLANMTMAALLRASILAHKF